MEPVRSRTARSAASADILDFRVYPGVFGANFGIDALAATWFHVGADGSGAQYIGWVRRSRRVGAGRRDMGLIGCNARRRLRAPPGAAMSAASFAALGERTGWIKQRDHQHHSGKSRFSLLHEVFSRHWRGLTGETAPLRDQRRGKNPGSRRRGSPRSDPHVSGSRSRCRLGFITPQCWRFAMNCSAASSRALAWRDRVALTKP